MKEYTWTVKDANREQNSLLVEYTFGEKSVTLNLPYPTSNINEHIEAFAPVETIAPITEVVVEIGQCGSAQIPMIGPMVKDETPNITGDWNDEHIRALIYQVLEEIRESSV